MVSAPRGFLAIDMVLFFKINESFRFTDFKNKLFVAEVEGCSENEDTSV